MRMPLIKSAFMGRANLGDYLNRRELTGYGVEVGTNRGEYAFELLSSWTGEMLYCVDPYTPLYDDRDPAALGDRGADELKALEVIQPFTSRCLLLPDTSEEACKTFPNGCLDFVYVDADHKPESVRADLELWWPKVKAGGVLAGHDMVMTGHGVDWGPGVQPVVFDFALKHGVDVYLVPEPAEWWESHDAFVSQPWSYFFVKGAI